MTIDRDQMIELARYTAGITRSRRQAYAEYVINPICRRCTDDATCGDCRYKARQLLKVATSEDECETLLTIIDRPSPVAAKCGTYGGFSGHVKRGTEICQPCRDASNTYQVNRRKSREAS